MKLPNVKGWYKSTWREDLELPRKQPHWSWKDAERERAASPNELRRRAILAEL